MEKLSKNISRLVFKRNIPYKMETYILNCEMLQVLAEMDGIQTVAAIAAKLNRQVGDLVTTFATLYQQKLIFLVRPDPTIITQPSARGYGFHGSRMGITNGYENANALNGKAGCHDKANKYFEHGVLLLKRRFYKKALQQFELALELDPKNRLCHAYINRILKLLKRDVNRHLSAT